MCARLGHALNGAQERIALCGTPLAQFVCAPCGRLRIICMSRAASAVAVSTARSASLAAVRCGFVQKRYAARPSRARARRPPPPHPTHVASPPDGPRRRDTSSPHPSCAVCHHVLANADFVASCGQRRRSVAREPKVRGLLQMDPPRLAVPMASSCFRIHLPAAIIPCVIDFSVEPGCVGHTSRKRFRYARRKRPLPR